MRGVKDGEKFEKNYINEDGTSQTIKINKKDSNGYNTFCEDSYLNSKFNMEKIYGDGTVLDTKIDEHKKGIGRGKLLSVKMTGIKK